MSLLVLGVSHRTAPLSVLEKVVVAEPDQPKLLARIAGGGQVAEALVLSTCNRIEVWAVVEAFHAGVAHIGEALARHTGAGERELTEHCYVHYGKAAVQHVFSVAASLDSMVVGEQQILGQVRAAYATATSAGTVGAGLHGVVQQALRTGKAAQSQTAVAHAGPSMVSRALDQVAAHLPAGWDGAKVGIVGAGAIGSLVVADLKERAPGLGEVVTFSKTQRSARRLAETAASGGLTATAGAMTELVELLGSFDVLVTCAGAVGTLLVAEDFAMIGEGIVVCDLSVPRDVDPSVADLPGVRVVDTQSLAEGAAQTLDQEALRAVEALVAKEVAAYLQGQLQQSVVPTVTALRQRADEVVAEELLRLETKLPGLDQAQRAEVTKSVRRVVDKLLHTPTTRVKELAGGGDGGKYAEALRELFGLAPGSVAAVTGTGSHEPGGRESAPEGAREPVR
ncbi:glutamyl-tRNA reductase [Segniliparus rugosus]|uniref:Glutamyl-tRNA reductase n=1 Tax=Segniliparus rugosus (strain ATCC BAA-974 / DSM 45345 / CCUG 50838 / CIP 108380 / JCM 13579 / CDC 945) TaxID=679197 RepID=E5XPF6_SEGRC|nr:glutamyl-tRNA reductase [Segniliparus rugosus]EFV13767.1 glutamyl-tRNA reductase [Segniliparus rugosus ATCC BAA-974]